MKHYYQNIQRWFNFSNLYLEMVNKFPDGSHYEYFYINKIII